MAPPTLFCFGIGYSASRLLRRLRAEGWTVAGTVRDPARAAALRAEGIAAVPFDRGRPVEGIASALAGATHVLSSVPPDAGGDPVLDVHGGDLAAAAGRPAWVGYLSTTGVYGDTGGAWVDEDSPTAAGEPHSLGRLAAERAWLALHRDRGLPVHAFRLAGIYGPGRSAIDDLRAGRARRIDKPGQVFSRIHVDDIATVLRASMARPDPGAIYNVCDDAPSPAHEVVAHAAHLLGMEPPPLIPFEQAELTPLGRSFYSASRRVRNDRIKRELGVRLACPDYRAGLAAILSECRKPAGGGKGDRSPR